MKTVVFAVSFLMFSLLCAGPAAAAKESIDQEVKAALQALYAKEAGAKALGDKAKGILVFPNVRKAGFVVSGQQGDGAMLKKGRITDYYSSSALGVGLEAGAQSYSFALFYMTDEALKDFENRDEYELGAGANVVFVDSGAAAGAGSAVSPAGVYGFVFGQKGLMAGVSLQGTKIKKTGSAAK
jgi:lipid-binding SYLF domain-containing protein